MGDINDSVDKNQGRGYIIENNVIDELAGMTKISTKRSVKTRSKISLGKRVEEVKIVGITNDGTLTVEHYETGRFNRMLDEYEQTGKMPIFDLQIINEDNSTNVGRRVVRYYDCMIKGDVSLSDLEESSEDAITSDIPFAFRTKKILEDYNKVK